MNLKSISILGCGWLGLPLAQHLLTKNFIVKGSTTSEEKLSLLSDSGVEPYHIQCEPDLKGEQINDFFSSQVLFLNIPFKRSLEDPKFYQYQIESVIERVVQSPIQYVIFASSTSVYPKQIERAYEDLEFQPDNPRAQTLWDVEQFLFGQQKFKTAVVRFSGLYGGSRQIGRFLAGQKDLKGAEEVVNLIHLDDCVGLIDRILELECFGEIFNACSDEHPTRKELYTNAADHLGLPQPTFVEESKSISKIVDNSKIKTLLNYTFKHPNPLICS